MSWNVWNNPKRTENFLEWSQVPGAFERHLQRRHNNPLFPENRRIVTQSEIEEAQLTDRQWLEAAKQEVRAIVDDLQVMDLSDRHWGDSLAKMRERIDAVLDFVYVLGPQGSELRNYVVTKIRPAVIDTWRDFIKHDPNFVAMLESAEQTAQARVNSMKCTDWLCQLANDSKVIPADELFASLLSEEDSDIQKTMNSLESDPNMKNLLVSIRNNSLNIVNAAIVAGHSMLGIEQKLKIIGVTV